MNKKVIRSIVIMIILSISYINFEDTYKNGIKFLFEGDYFLWIYTIAVVIAFSIHFWYKIETSSDLKMFKSEIAIFDSISNITTFLAIGSTALTLLKGIYLQKFFKVVYFINFADFDLGIIFAVSCALLWLVIVRIAGLYKEALYYQPQTINN